MAVEVHYFSLFEAVVCLPSVSNDRTIMNYSGCGVVFFTSVSLFVHWLNSNVYDAKQ